LTGSSTEEIEGGRQLADGFPNGRFRLLEGQEHVVSLKVLVPVVAEFFGH
jgi:hypothetical protein